MRRPLFVGAQIDDLVPYGHWPESWSRPDLPLPGRQMRNDLGGEASDGGCHQHADMLGVIGCLEDPPIDSPTRALAGFYCQVLGLRARVRVSEVAASGWSSVHSLSCVWRGFGAGQVCGQTLRARKGQPSCWKPGFSYVNRTR